MEKITSLSQEKLLQVNELILERMHSNIPLISQIAKYILSAGGKRLRPILALSSSKLLNYNNSSNQDIYLASAVELIHTATLLHDDVVDNSSKRRNKKTANEVWGNQITILVGDFLFSQAFELMVKTNSLDVLQTLSNASSKIAEGEINQLQCQSKPETTTEEYLEIITGKTAKLFSAACKSGALISTNNIDQIKALEIYGKELGVAYQLVDDALDYISETPKLGKSVGDDFKDGKVSLPIIISWNKGTKDEKNFWTRAISNLDQNENDFNKAKELINKYNGIMETYALAKSYSQKAVDALSIFESCEVKDGLIEVANFTTSRVN
jgi:octaprenyl-diphosphate synthase